jgi:hypothetical protein
MTGVAAYGVVNVARRVLPGSSGTAGDAGHAAAPFSGDAVSLAKHFLKAWAAGQLDDASQDTDSVETSASALQGYHDDLGVRSLTFSAVSQATAGDPAQPDDVVVQYHARLMVGAGSTAWSYDGSLHVRRIQNQPAVRWHNSVLYPDLHDGQKLVTAPIPMSQSAVTAADGTPLNASTYPSLAGVISGLTAKHPPRGSAGVGIEIRNADGTVSRVLKTITQPKVTPLRTTIDARLQAAAERAVRDSHIAGKPTALVAVDPATGHIKAIADTSGTTALSGALAPGSTMKLITAAALIDKGGLTGSSPSSCTPTVMINGQTFHNVDNESATGSNMTQAFAMSCNTAFIRMTDNHLGMTDLKQEADTVFGLDGDWQTGVGTVDAKIPDPSGDRNERAADAIGQGRIIANPLAMASVTATIAQGAFRQPILIPGLPQTKAARQISPSTAAAVRMMMRDTARYGTAASRMSGIDGGAKTGTAEVGASTNGWFVAYDRHIAVAAVVQGGHSGADSAGWAVRDVLIAD